MQFVENEFSNSSGFENFSSQIKTWIDYYILQVIFKEAKPTTYTKPHEAILNSITKLRDKGIEPNLIFVGNELAYNREFDAESSLFKYNYRLKEEEKPKFGIGLFDNIPVVNSLSGKIKNQVIVAHLNQAFDLGILENEEWVDKKLCVNVNETSREEAVKIYEESPDRWNKDPEGVEVSYDEAIDYIMNGIHFEIFTKLRFQILDSEAFVVSAFEPIKRH